MCAETFIGLCLLGTAIVGYFGYLTASRINWAMVYFNMLGGEEYDCK